MKSPQELVVEARKIADEYDDYYVKPSFRENKQVLQQAKYIFLDKLHKIGLSRGVSATFLSKVQKNKDDAFSYLQHSVNTDYPVTPEKAAKRKQPDTPDTIEKKKAKMSTFIEDEEMENAPELQATSTASVARTAAATTGGSNGGLYKETPLSKFSPFLGVPDTANVILPWTTYFTVITVADSTTTEVNLRLNTPYDSLVTQVNTPVPSATTATGIYNRKPAHNQVNGNWPNPLWPYPQTIPAGVNTTECPWYRRYYDKLYEKYACLGCEYEITMQNAVMNEPNYDVTVAYGVDSFSANNAGRKFPVATLSQMQYWPDISFKKINSTGDNVHDGSYSVIKGQYKSGSATRNVQNDEDLKTWTDVGATPSLTELLVLRFANSEFNKQDARIPIMVKVQMKFIVQFKDKKQNIRYPTAGLNPFTLTFPTDILQAQNV